MRMALLSPILVLLLISAAHAIQTLPVPKNVNMGINYTRYANHSAYLSALNAVKALRPDLVKINTGGTSCTGEYPLYYVTIGDTSKPAFFFMSASHCWNEWYGANVIVELLRKFVDPNDNQKEFNTKLLQEFCIIAVPMVNPWGYYSGPDGKHHNGHSYPVPNISALTWHDPTNYSTFLGVNLNRNFDIGWNSYQDVPFSVGPGGSQGNYWTPPGPDSRGITQANGSYNYANYFMMPYVMADGVETDDEKGGYGVHNNHLMKPNQDLYDGKGTSAFSEPETQLIRDLVNKHNVIGFYDLHTMNPWDNENQSMGSSADNYSVLVSSLAAGIACVNARHGSSMPTPASSYMEDYAGGNAPYSTNWARNAKRIKSFTWESGTNYPQTVWTDAYFEVIYRGMYWMQPDIPVSVTSFFMPSAAASRTVAVSAFAASANTKVSGYMITESAIKPSAASSGWGSTAPTSFTFSSPGAKTVYAWAKDSSGHVSIAATASVSITLSPSFAVSSQKGIGPSSDTEAVPQIAPR